LFLKAAPSAAFLFFGNAAPLGLAPVSLPITGLDRSGGVMFADSLLESSWEARSHRGWMTLASFAAQLLGLGTLLLLPMFYIEGLPSFRLSTPDILQVPAAAPRPAPQTVVHHRASSNLNQSGLIVIPTTIPRSIQQILEPVAPPISPGAVDTQSAWTPGSTGRGNRANGVVGSVGDFVTAVAPPVIKTPHPPVSVMMQGNLIDRIQPNYPPIARAVGVQGQVILRAIISRQGTIANLQVVSGHPMLVKAAVDAVKQWRYRPYVLNGQPVEVETQITVNFLLSGG
jgi:periplasmic protein TonB